MKEIKLFEHNQDIVNRIERAMEKGERKIFFTEATGLGKTFVFMYLVNKYFKDKKVLYVCPRNSIWEQTSSREEFENIKHCVDMCCYADFNRIKERHYNYDVYFIDEAHHLFSDIQGSNIVSILDSLLKKNENAYAFAMSATPYNRNGKMVGDVFFDSSVEGNDIFQAMDKGLLQPIKYAIAIDDMVKNRKNYYYMHQMKRFGRKHYNVDTTKIAISNLMNDYSYVNHWLAYFPKIKELENNLPYFSEYFPEYKIFVLHSKADNIENVLDEFESYEGKAILASVSMILEGVHPKTVEGVLSYRNIHSYNLFFQMIGRLGIMNHDVSPVFIDIYKSFMNISPPIKRISDDDGFLNSRNGPKNQTEYMLMHSNSYKLINFSNILEKLRMSNAYRGIIWINDADLSRKLGKHDGYVSYYKRKGLSHKEIIDMVLGPKEYSYRGITWTSDVDLSRKLGKDDKYVSRHKRQCISYKRIIDQVLDYKEYTYRSITWTDDKDLSRKLGKSSNYVSYYKSKGFSCEEIIDRVLDPKIYSYRGITWTSDMNLSRELGKDDNYISIRLSKGLSYEQIIDQVLGPKVYSYRGINWTSYADLSRQLGRDNGYVSRYIRGKGLSCEEIIDEFLDRKIKSYRGITWTSEKDLSKKLCKDDNYVTSCRFNGLSYKEIIDQALDEEKTYRNIIWTTDTDLSRKLGKEDDYVAYYRSKNLSHQEIIDQVLGRQCTNTYRDITWTTDIELSRKLGKDDDYVNRNRNNGLSYIEIINKVYK